jgi:hypothetical protein
MPILGDVRDAFFGERPVTHVLYGDIPGQPLFETLLSREGIPSIGDPELDLATQRDAAIGYHPILVVAYDRVFDRDVPGTRLSDYLGDVQDKWDFRHRFAVAASRPLMEIFVQFIERMNLRGGFTCRVREDTYFMFSVNAGERLVNVTFSLEPVPGEPVAA